MDVPAARRRPRRNRVIKALVHRAIGLQRREAACDLVEIIQIGTAVVGGSEAVQSLWLQPAKGASGIRDGKPAGVTVDPQRVAGDLRLHSLPVNRLRQV